MRHNRDIFPDDTMAYDRNSFFCEEGKGAKTRMRVRQYQQHQHIEGYVKVTGGVGRLRWDRPESAEGNICDEA